MDADITTIQINHIEDWYDLRYKLKTAQMTYLYKNTREFDSLLKAVDDILKLASEPRNKYLRYKNLSAKRVYEEKIAEANSVIGIMQEHLFLVLLQNNHK
jgi:hypothetical protein